MEELAKFLASCAFATPLYFWIGGALVLLLIFFPWARKRRGLAIDLQYWKPRVAFKSKRLLVLSIPVVIISILMAGVLSDPQVTVRSSAFAYYGKPVMVVIDISGSMDTIPQPRLVDQRTNLEKASAVFEDLIARRADINFGLLLYSTDRYIARYFTYKNELLKDTMENKEEINYTSTGTRTAEALMTARLFLTDNIEDEADKAIVLITDLECDIEAMLRMDEEMERVLSAGINLYEVVIGAEEQGAVMDQICKELSEMQSSLIMEEEVLLKKSLIPFLIPPALGLITLCLILGETRFRKIP